MKRLVHIWRKNPVIFAKQALGFVPDEWQSGALNDIRDHDQVAIRSGQGVGKTSVEAVIILWFLVCFSNAKVICTAPTKQQLNEVLWAEVAKWLVDSKIKNILKWTKTKVYMIGSEQRWFATAKTATRPENMQGFHEDNMLFVVDEASGIDDRIMEAILGTLSGGNNKIIMMANPTQTSGIFYDAFHKDRGDWKTRKVSSLDSSRTNKRNIERLIRRYGKDSDVVRVRVNGDFPKGSPDAWISLEDIEQATMRELPDEFTWNHEGYWNVSRYTPIELGIDVARYGGDETIIATRLGNYVDDLLISSKEGLMQTVGRIMRQLKLLIKRYPGRKIVVKIDDTGLGGGATDRLIEIVGQEKLPVKVIPINFAQKGSQHYEGIVSDMYGYFKDEVLPEVILPSDDELTAQFTVRKYSIKSDGKILIESKKSLKERGYPSPDRAEAVVMAFYTPKTAEAVGLKGGI